MRRGGKGIGGMGNPVHQRQIEWVDHEEAACLPHEKHRRRHAHEAKDAILLADGTSTCMLLCSDTMAETRKNIMHNAVITSTP